MTIAAMPDRTRELSAFLSTLRFDRIPARVIERTKELVLDHLGVALHSANLPWSRIVREYARSSGERAESTLHGSEDRVGRRAAALANGTAAHGIELDDTHNESFSHPGTVVIPAAFAVAEPLKAPGRDFLAAVVAGYEAQCRAGAAATDVKRHSWNRRCGSIRRYGGVYGEKKRNFIGQHFWARRRIESPIERYGARGARQVARCELAFAAVSFRRRSSSTAYRPVQFSGASSHHGGRSARRFGRSGWIPGSRTTIPSNSGTSGSVASCASLGPRIKNECCLSEENRLIYEPRHPKPATEFGTPPFAVDLPGCDESPDVPPNTTASEYTMTRLALAKRAMLRGMQTDLASGIESETFLVTTISAWKTNRKAFPHVWRSATQHFLTGRRKAWTRGRLRHLL